LNLSTQKINIVRVTTSYPVPSKVIILVILEERLKKFWQIRAYI